MITMGTLTSPSFDFVNTTSNIYNVTIITTMPFWLRLTTIICMILIDIFAFLGNLLVICAFFRTRRLQTVTNYFIASLAFADALVALFVLPLSIYYYYRDRSWKLGLILCDLWVSSDVLLCTSSILNLTCISVDRYMAITRPLTYTAYRSKFLARVMILLVWIVSAVITCPPILGWRDTNRRQTVEQEHKCDLNTARGYVVYSALGSFYIPAFVMIFVYIRIFMVVYDRENLIKKFRDSQEQVPVVKTSNGIVNNHNNNNNATEDLINKHSIRRKNPNMTPSHFCCWCFLPRQQHPYSPTTPVLPPSTSMNCPNVERKQNGYLVYRFTNNNNNNNNNNANSAPNTPPLPPTTTTTATATTIATTTTPSTMATSIFCHPCTFSTKKMSHISDELYHYRRNCFPRIGAEYQFRTGESPCYELKTFENSLPPLIKCRSRSFEQTSSIKVRDLNAELSRSRQLKAAAAAAAAAAATTTTINSSVNSRQEKSSIDEFTSIKDGNGSEKHTVLETQLDGFVLTSKDDDDDNHLFRTNLSAADHLHHVTRSLGELTHDVTSYHPSALPLLIPTEESPKYHSRQQTCHSHSNLTSSRTSPLTLPLTQQNFSNSRTCPNLEQQLQQKPSTPEPTRINRRIKQSRSAMGSPSMMLIDNFKQQHKTLINNSSVKSNQSARSLMSIRRLNAHEPFPKRQAAKSTCSCCCCWSPFARWCRPTSKRIATGSANYSMTNDDDDEEDKTSSNDTTNRTPILMTASPSLRGVESNHSNIVLSNHQQHHHHHRRTGGVAPGDVHRRERIRFMKEQKTAKTLAVVVGGFILFWLPFFIMYVIPPTTHIFHDHTVTLITWLGYFNSVINPFIYAYCSKHFRMAFWNITFGMCMKKSNALMPVSVKNKQLHRRNVIA